jgi:hypothetical protein
VNPKTVNKVLKLHQYEEVNFTNINNAWQMGLQLKVNLLNKQNLLTTHQRQPEKLVVAEFLSNLFMV